MTFLLAHNRRNSPGDATAGADGTLTATANGHSRDSDVILADNGDIHRLVGVTVNGQVQLAPLAPTGSVGGGVATRNGFLAFNYDVNRPGEPAHAIFIVPRAATLVDYTPGGPDFDPASAALDIGGDDEVHGESGDDFAYGQKGQDILYGDGQDDDLVGGYGNDWVSGGTGQDGILGDDGRVFTSRNSSIYGEPLNGVQSLLATDPDAKFSNGNVLSEFIYTPGNVQTAIINLADALKKRVDLTPFSTQPDWTPVQDEYGGTATHHNDDILFGGLGGDSMHGGSGDDAISGAEALVEGYTQVQDADFDLTGVARSDFNRPFNPGDALRFNPIDVDAQHPNRTRAGEFALYDEYDALRRILLSDDGTLYKGTGTAKQFFLNFDPTEGPAIPGGALPKGGTYPAANTDGDDVAFGDLGNDWIVGGTGRDDVFGGFGNDLINADDNHGSTAGTADPNANDVPDTQPSYEDRAYGGAGRDVLIGNTGGDRLIDWVGEFNSYLVPFAPFGIATVSRTLQPQLPEFLYALSASGGADFTRAADTGADPARNGEPEGELGLVLQKDAAWHDQTGGPADPQAGNIPGGKRDVLRSANFNDGQAQAFMADSGSWTVSAGRYQVAPATLGSDAVSVFYVDHYLPSYFEVLATINAGKPLAGYKSNSYVIFDYQGREDFKFAGINISTNKIEMGYRDRSGWHVVAQSNARLKADTDYNLTLAINGTAATLVVSNQASFAFTFAPRRDADGFPKGLNAGMIGIGANNAVAQIDNVAVQVLPPNWSVQRSDDFSAPTDLLTPASGTWQRSGGRTSATPAAGSTAAIGLVGFRVADPSSSVIDLAATLRTQSSGGFVFDYYSEDDFKFVLISASTQQVLIGHYMKRTGYVVDASASRVIAAGADYGLALTLRGSTVTVSLNGQLALSFAYNGMVTDGGFGLFSKDGSSAFDVLSVKSSGAAVPA